MKKCFKCGLIQSLDDFYKHPAMTDGHLGKCKTCARQDSRPSNGKHRRSCIECATEFNTNATEINRGGGKLCSRECYYAYQPKMLEDKFSGTKMTYSGVHEWVKRKLGQPSVCEHCSTTEAKAYDWSNISHEYKRDLSDWQRLCRSCHIKYDDMPTTRKKTLIERYGTTSMIPHMGAVNES